MSAAEIFQTYVAPLLPIVTIVVALVGWGVIIRNTRRIATRSESFTVVQGLLGILDKVEVEARDYWLKNADTWTRAKASGYVGYITDSIESLRVFMEVAQQRRIEIQSVAVLGNLRQALTLDAERLSTVEQEQRVHRMTVAATELRELRKQSLQCFMSRYPIDVK